VVWLGIYAYLFRIDKRVTKIEQELETKG